MDYDERLRREAERWAPEAKASSSHGNWMRLACVQRHINAMVSGAPEVQWADGIGREFLFGRIRDGRGLTLGCSDGGAERHALASGLFRTFDAFDISPQAVAEARRVATEQALPIDYRVADVNWLELPEQSYDLVVVVMALHHFERLEHVLDQVARSLRPNGLFVFNEFVGATRFQWSDRQLELVNAALQLLPAALRRRADGTLLTAIGRPDLATMARDDPFEAIRSQEILPLVAERFSILAERPYGGTILHPLLDGIAQNFDEANAEHRAVLTALLDFEATQLRAGLPSDFTVVVAGKQPAR